MRPEVDGIRYIDMGRTFNWDEVLGMIPTVTVDAVVPLQAHSKDDRCDDLVHGQAGRFQR